MTFAREDQLDLMSLNVKLLSVAGVIPSTSITGSTWRRIIYDIFSIIVLLCYLLVLTSQLLAMHRFWGDLDVLTENAYILIGVLMCYLMWAYFSRRAASVLHLVHILETSITSSVCNKKLWQHAKEIMSVADRKARFLTWSLFLMSLTTGLAWIVAPFALRLMRSGSEEVVDDKKPPPYFCFIAWLPFEITKSPLYEVVYLAQVITTVRTILLYTSIVTIIITFIIHIEAQLRILAWAVRNIDTHFPAELSSTEDGQYAAVPTDTSGEINAYFVECIEHHKSVMRFVIEVNNLLSPLILFFLLCSQLSMCTMAFQVVLSLAEDKNPVKLVLGLLASSSGPLIFCWYGEQVIQASMEVREAAYASLWYHRTSYFKRTLCFVIMRSLKPIRLTGIFYDLSLRTYMQMLNAVYTYFAVLNHLHNK